MSNKFLYACHLSTLVHDQYERILYIYHYIRERKHYNSSLEPLEYILGAHKIACTMIESDIQKNFPEFTPKYDSIYTSMQKYEQTLASQQLSIDLHTNGLIYIPAVRTYPPHSTDPAPGDRGPDGL